MLEANIPEALPAMEVTNRPITAQTLHTFEEATVQGCMSVACVVLSLTTTRLGKAGMQIGKKLTQKSKAAAAKNQAHCRKSFVCTTH